MAKPPSPGQCIHCLQTFKHLTWDHVIPESWYPEVSSSEFEKWQVPACIDCNHMLGRVEKDLLERLGLCLDPNDPKCHGIPEKALRATKPEYAKSSRDAEHRAARRAKLIRQMFQIDQLPVTGLLPHFGPLSDLEYEGKYVAVPIPEAAILTFGEKVIRGIAFITAARYIEPPLTVKVFVVKEASVPEVDQLLRQTGTRYDICPGIELVQAVSHETKEGLYWIRLWGRFEVYGSVIKPPENRAPVAAPGH